MIFNAINSYFVIMKKIPFKTNAGVMPKEKKGNIKNMNPEVKRRIKANCEKIRNRERLNDVDPDKQSDYSEIMRKKGTGRKLNDIDRAKLVPIILKDNIDRIDQRLLDITDDLLAAKSIKVRMFAWKELLKYRLPQKHKVEADININISVMDYTDEVSQQQHPETDFSNYELLQNINNITDAEFDESN